MTMSAQVKVERGVYKYVSRLMAALDSRQTADDKNLPAKEQMWGTIFL